MPATVALAGYIRPTHVKTDQAWGGLFFSKMNRLKLNRKSLKNKKRTTNNGMPDKKAFTYQASRDSQIWYSVNS